MAKSKVTITLDESLVSELDRRSEKQKRSRSRLVEDAIRWWSRWQQQKELIDGYRSMSREDQETAEEQLPVAWETIQ